MKLIIDDAHIDLIKKIYEYYPVDGVTTNPSILAKSGRQPFEVLKEIRSFIGEEAELHVQVVAKDADGMVDDAHRIVNIDTRQHAVYEVIAARRARDVERQVDFRVTFHFFRKHDGLRLRFFISL